MSRRCSGGDSTKAIVSSPFGGCAGAGLPVDPHPERSELGRERRGGEAFGVGAVVAFEREGRRAVHVVARHVVPSRRVPVPAEVPGAAEHPPPDPGDPGVDDLPGERWRSSTSPRWDRRARGSTGSGRLPTPRHPMRRRSCGSGTRGRRCRTSSSRAGASRWRPGSAASTPPRGTGSASSSPTATETRRDPDRVVDRGHPRRLRDLEAQDRRRAGLVQGVLRRPTHAQPDHADVVERKHGAASACDAGSSTSSSSTFHPSSDRRCSSTT